MFRVYARPNGGAVARLGIVTSKRISRRAVERNFCKRLVREVFRAEGKNLESQDFVVRPLAPVTPQTAVAARAELRGLLLRVQRQGRACSETLRNPDADR